MAYITWYMGVSIYGIEYRVYYMVYITWYMGVLESRGPEYGPQIGGLLSEGQAQKRPAIYGNSQYVGW